jgi:hypothetical protein
MPVAFMANIRLGWNVLTMTNALAHYEHLQIKDRKKFYNIGPRMKLILMEQTKTLLYI